MLSACKVDPCEDIICNNGIPLQDGYECFCLCDRGWFGDNCDREDPCQTQTINCYNGGTCLNGSCVCDVGFSGDTCEIEDRKYFEGSYTADLKCPPAAPQTINFSITAPDSLSATDIILFNITNQSYLIEGRIDDNGNVVIPNQSSATETINGTITRTNQGFIIDYELRDAGGSQFCELEIIK